MRIIWDDMCKTIGLSSAGSANALHYYYQLCPHIIVTIRPLNNLEVIGIFLDISFLNQYFFTWFWKTVHVLSWPHSLYLKSTMFTWLTTSDLSSSWLAMTLFLYIFFILILSIFQVLPQISSFLWFHWIDVTFSIYIYIVSGILVIN